MNSLSISQRHAPPAALRAVDQPEPVAGGTFEGRFAADVSRACSALAPPASAGGFDAGPLATLPKVQTRGLPTGNTNKQRPGVGHTAKTQAKAKPAELDELQSRPKGIQPAEPATSRGQAAVSGQTESSIVVPGDLATSPMKPALSVNHSGDVADAANASAIRGSDDPVCGAQEGVSRLVEAQVQGAVESGVSTSVKVAAPSSLMVASSTPALLSSIPVNVIAGAASIVPGRNHGPLVTTGALPPSRPNDAEEHSVLTARPNVLEVGLSSDAHGWLKVRAEVDGHGAVAASLTGHSALAAETLHRALPALAVYLASEAVPVGSLTVRQAGPEGARDEPTAGTSGMDQRGERQSRRASTDSVADTGGATALPLDGISLTAVGTSAGGWVNVLA